MREIVNNGGWDVCTLSLRFDADGFAVRVREREIENLDAWYGNGTCVEGRGGKVGGDTDVNEVRVWRSWLLYVRV